MAKECRVGVQLPEVEREVRWPEYASMACAAEEVGFDSIWVGDHYLYRGDDRPERGPWEAWTMLAGLAAITERVRLGPLVACLNFHDPAVLAKTAATVDELSGGRLIFGVGAGWNRTEFDAFGIPYDHRASRFEEAFEIVRRLLDGERMTFEGRFHQVRDAVLLPRPERRPPLMAGSTGERVLAATLPHVDIWNTWFDWYGNTAEGFHAKQREIDEACERAGRDPSSIERSACVLVRLDGDAQGRPDEPGVTALEGSLDEVGAGLRAIGGAGRGRGRGGRDRGGRRRRADPRARPDHRRLDPDARRRRPDTSRLSGRHVGTPKHHDRRPVALRGDPFDPAMMEHLGGPLQEEGLAEKLVRDAEATAADRYWVLVIVPDDDPGVGGGTIAIWDHVLHGEQINEIGWMVLPPFQGHGMGSAAAQEAIDRARTTGRWDVLHAYPPVANPRSNAMCRTLGFEMLEERDFEYRGRKLRCNHLGARPRACGPHMKRAAFRGAHAARC